MPRGYGDTFYIDEIFVNINGKLHYLWRAVDQDGEVIDVYLQPGETELLQSASSSDYCGATRVSPGRL